MGDALTTWPTRRSYSRGRQVSPSDVMSRPWRQAPSYIPTDCWEFERRSGGDRGRAEGGGGGGGGKLGEGYEGEGRGGGLLLMGGPADSSEVLGRRGWRFGQPLSTRLFSCNAIDSRNHLVLLSCSVLARIYLKSGDFICQVFRPITLTPLPWFSSTRPPR